MKRNGLWIILLWLATMLNALATNVYVCVPGGAVAQYPYTNWGMAATNIQDAVDAIITNDGNYVFVSNGTYYLTNQIVITNGITLQSWNHGVPDQTNTIIHGNNYAGKPVTNRCVYMNHPLARLIGFTITKGWATNDSPYGGGVFITNTGYIADCIITGNMVGNSGGGIYTTYATGTIERCTISRNLSAGSAGGMLIGSGSIITVRQCVVSFNTASGGYGGGGYMSGANVEARDCSIISNKTLAALGAGGGLFLRTGAVARNCLIVGNTAAGTTGGGGAAFWSGNSKVINCTITSNCVTYDKGGGVVADIDSLIYYVENSIVYGNSRIGAAGTYSNYYEDTIGQIRWTNCCSAPSLNDLSPGTNVNNITDNPQFAGAAMGNYRLARSSPCVNTGVNRDWMTPQAGGLDLDSNHRIMMGVVDMGAYELLPPAGTIFEFR